MDGMMLARRVIVAALVLSATVACKGKETDARFAGADMSGPYDKIVLKNIAGLEKSSGLRFKTFPRVKATSAAEVRACAEKAITVGKSVAALIDAPVATPSQTQITPVSNSRISPIGKSAPLTFPPLRNCLSPDGEMNCRLLRAPAILAGIMSQPSALTL